MPTPLLLTVRFPFWWYYEVPGWFLKMAHRIFLFLDGNLSVTLMIKLWLTPLFGDPNLVGHFIGIVFRTSRITFGLIVILLSELALIFYFLVWLAVPFLIFSRLGSFSVILLIFWFGFYLFVHREMPSRQLPEYLKPIEDPSAYLGNRTIDYINRSRSSVILLELLTKDAVVKEIIARLGFERKESLWEDLGAKKERLKTVPISDVVREGLRIALEVKDKSIDPCHLFLALFKKCGYKEEEALGILAWRKKRKVWHRVPFIWEETFTFEGLAGFNRGWTGRVTPNLNKFGVDLTAEAKDSRLPLLVGKTKPLAEVVRVLEKSSKNNVILVGQPGCGKTSLVYGIAEEIVSGTRSRALMDKRVFSLEIGKLIAGAATSGDLQERMISIIKDIEASGNIILFIDEIQNAVSAGGGVDTSLVFGALEPHLTGRRLQVIGATSWKNYRRYIEPNEAFARLFELVEVPEAGFSEALEILELLSFDLEKKYKVLISFPALKTVVELSAKYIYEKVLPDKAVDLLEETVADVAKNFHGKIILPHHVESIITEKTNIPLTKVSKDESESLLNLEERMHEKLVDQDEAVSAIANSIRRARVGLRDERRPIVSLLFIGPTGVGKTETAKTLAETFFGKEETMLRFDMSEYQSQESVTQLIGNLTDRVRRSPFSLVLFDEIEKSHPKILDIFLQVLEDGRLTDASGLTVSFSNTIIVFTSNAGTSLIFSKLRSGLRIEDFRQELLRELEGSFRVELLNRFDGIIIFKPLSAEHVEMVTRLKLKKVESEMAKNEVKISFTEGLVKRLSNEGFDQALGARPLRRLIQDKIESVLAKKILRGEIGREQEIVLGEEILEG